MPNWLWFPIAAGAIVSVLGWIYLSRLMGTGPAPTRPTSGADPKFVGELKALKDAPVDPALIKDIEMDLAWGLAWHEFERGMQVEIDRVFAPLLAAMAEAENFDEVRDLVTA